MFILKIKYNFKKALKSLRANGKTGEGQQHIYFQQPVRPHLQLTTSKVVAGEAPSLAALHGVVQNNALDVGRQGSCCSMWQPPGGGSSGENELQMVFSWNS